MENIVRKVTILKSFVNELPSGQIIERPMVYQVDSQYTVVIDGEQVKKKICQIEESPTHLFVYLQSGDEFQLWNKIPKNELTIIEYKLD